MSSDHTPQQATYRQVGRSGLRVSVPIFGAMGIGDKRAIPWAIGEDEALPILKAAYDRGVNTWDTSNSYSGGVSEAILGSAIKKLNLPRHKLVLMTKCCNPAREDNTPELLAMKPTDLIESKDYVNQFGLSRQAIIASCNASLARLQTDYIDLFQIHRYDPAVPIEETMEALHDLVKSGKVRYIGASSMFAYQFVMMQECAARHGWTKFISMQNHYSLLYREEEREMNKYCFETGIGLLSWGPLDTGRLSRPRVQIAQSLPTESATVANGSPHQNVTSPSLRASVNKSVVISDQDALIIDRVEKVAKEKGWSMSQVAFAWIFPRVSSPIGSFSTIGRMDEAISAAISMRLSADEERFLEEPYQPRAIKGHGKWVGM